MSSELQSKSFQCLLNISLPSASQALKMLQLLLVPHTNHHVLLTTLVHVVTCLSMWLCRSESLEAQLKSLLYYFRHHTVEPEILKRLCFVEIVYMLQNHANRCVPLKIPPVCCLLLCMLSACLEP